VLTFEYELFLVSEVNRTLLLSVYKEFHPDTEIEVNANTQIYSKNFADKVKAQKGKSELALRLATHLENGAELNRLFQTQAALSEEQYLATLNPENKVDYSAYKDFTVPLYIQNAIKYAVKGETNV
jgi:hypothetical protein